MKFRSGFEKTIWDKAKRQRKKLEFEPFYIPYVIKGNYLADFVLPNGIIIEAKGYLDTAAKKKMRAVKTSNPELDIRFVFQDASKKLTKHSRMTYGEWADKYGFPWAEKFIPLEWWKEKKD